MGESNLAGSYQVDRLKVFWGFGFFRNEDSSPIELQVVESNFSLQPKYLNT
jgi:hypothetical protein